MIEMCMGNQRGVQRARIDRKGLPVSLPQLFQSLILTTLYEYRDSLTTNQELAACYRPDTTEKLDLDHDQNVMPIGSEK